MAIGAFSFPPTRKLRLGRKSQRRKRGVLPKKTCIVLTVKRKALWNHLGFSIKEVYGDLSFSPVVETNLPEPDALAISCLLDRSNLISDAFKVRGAGEVPSF